MMTEAERRAVARYRARLLVMNVIRQRTDLIAWYQRLGFRATGAVSPFPYEDEHVGLPRRPDLEFAEFSKPLV